MVVSHLSSVALVLAAVAATFSLAAPAADAENFRIGEIFCAVNVGGVSV